MTDPFAHGTPVGDHHMWVSPAAGDPCPHCDCCTKRLCARAIKRGTACHWEAAAGDVLAVSDCPCWRPGSSARSATILTEDGTP